jgi:hypothetical protein
VANFKEALAPPPAAEEGTLAAATAAKPAPVDILLTHEWPTQITHLSAKPPTDTSFATSGVPAISEILAAAKPRYHFTSAHPVFWEREAFKWGNKPNAPFTRFYSLAKFGNEAKERAFYAFHLAPGDSQPAPATATSCPLDAGNTDSAPRGAKRPFGIAEDEEGSEPQNFIFDGDKKKRKPPADYICRLCNETGHFIQDCSLAGQGQREPQGKRDRKERDKPPRKELTRSLCVLRYDSADFRGQLPNAGSACRTQKSRST